AAWFILRVVFLSDPGTPVPYALSLHDAIPICCGDAVLRPVQAAIGRAAGDGAGDVEEVAIAVRAGAEHRVAEGDSVALSPGDVRSEEHTSELQSRENLVCRRLLEKKKNKSVLV